MNINNLAIKKQTITRIICITSHTILQTGSSDHSRYWLSHTYFKIEAQREMLECCIIGAVCSTLRDIKNLKVNVEQHTVCSYGLNSIGYTSYQIHTQSFRLFLWFICAHCLIVYIRIFHKSVHFSRITLNGDVEEYK